MPHVHWRTTTRSPELPGRVVEQNLALGVRHQAEQVARLLEMILVNPVVVMRRRTRVPRILRARLSVVARIIQ